MEVTPLLKKMIYKNSHPELVLAKKLLTQKHNRYLKAEKKSYEIEEKLSKLLQKILMDNTTQDNRLVLGDAYRALVKEFLAEIALINRYNDQAIDKRGAHLIDSSVHMKPATVRLEPAESAEEASFFEKPVNPSDAMPIVSSSENLLIEAKFKKESFLTQEKEFLIEEIKTLAKTLKSLSKKKNSENTQKLIEVQKLKLKLRAKLVELAFFPGITVGNNAFLKNVTEEMNKTVDLLDSFKEAIRLGDTARVTQIYPYVQSDNLYPIFSDFIVNQLVDAKEEHLKKLMMMAEYFYENSDCYRNTIIALDCGLDSTLMDICHIKRSLLFRAFNLDNYLAFELMLRQGFNPNGIGIAGEVLTASIMNAIVYFMSPPDSEFKDLRYLEVLLSFGALVNFKTSELTLNIREHTESIVKQKIIQKAIKKVEKTQKIRLKPFKSLKLEKSSEDKGDFLNVKDMTEMQKSALEILCTINKNRSRTIECFKLLVAEGDLADLIGAWVSLVNVADVVSRVIAGTKERHLLCCANKNEADQLNNRLTAEGGQKNVSLIMYHANQAKEKIWLENINFLISALTKKHTEILEQYPDHIISLYDIFIKKGKESTCLADSVYFYTAALYLMFLNPKPAFQDTQKIVQALCFLGQTHYNNRIFDSVSINRAKEWLYRAFLCCTKLQFAAALQETPLFKYTEKKLLELGVLRPQVSQMDNRDAQTLPPPTPTVCETQTGEPILTALVLHANRATPSNVSTQVVRPAGSGVDLTKIRKLGSET